MKNIQRITMQYSRLICQFLHFPKRCINIPSRNTSKFAYKYDKSKHCYNLLFPWNNLEEFSKYLASTITYNKDGLIALNKPFGIKINSIGKLDKRPKSKQISVVSHIPECNFTIEDSLESLKNILNVENLFILKSAERYTSGLVLMSTNEKTTAAVKRSFSIAKHQKKEPHLTHWMITLGYPVVSFREERVALKFLEDENVEMKQPIIVTEFSINEVKRNEAHPVRVIHRTLSVNSSLTTSLVQISTSSTKWHFVRVYASGRINTILGDVMYSNRMNTFMGMPVKLHIEQAAAFGMQPIPENMAEALHVESGVEGHAKIPAMLHLRSILLPHFKKGDDLLITAGLPTHFQWTAEQLKLI